MEKLSRFIVLAIVYILMVIFSFLVIPSISWLFGGEFVSVLQHPAHIIFILLVSGIGSGCILSDCFDEDFRAK